MIIMTKFAIKQLKKLNNTIKYLNLLFFFGKVVLLKDKRIKP